MEIGSLVDLPLRHLNHYSVNCCKIDCRHMNMTMEATTAHPNQTQIMIDAKSMMAFSNALLLLHSQHKIRNASERSFYGIIYYLKRYEKFNQVFPFHTRSQPETDSNSALNEYNSSKDNSRC